MSITTSDQSVRVRALNPNQSFIVQAPAGSGKTELLVRRFLVLLAQTERRPEEIIAITFTRKAAAEMRQRILNALQQATAPPPADSYAYETWQLARAAIEKNNQLGWQLLENSQRLRIQTIDALCFSLTRRTPLLSGLSPSATIIDNAHDYYLLAARQLLAQLEQPSTQHVPLARLLIHLDNRIDEIEQLLVGILMCRDQWLPHLISHHQHPNSIELRTILENALQRITADALADCYAAMPNEYQEDLLFLLRYAATNLTAENPLSLFNQCTHITQLPTPHVSNCEAWLAIAQLVLTEKNDWRVKVDKRNGFPADNKLVKDKMTALLNQLRKHANLRQCLQMLREAPPNVYTNNQWQIVEALIELLPLLVAELSVLFMEHNQVDFTQVSIAALNALEDQDSPTELALRLDQQIRHLLVDEFQDTSITQYNLLQKLTLGWQPGDGRTLFLVGDPMQSIYRFRQAEVGLFIKAQQEGIGEIYLESLKLSANFRSTTQLVTWFNRTFNTLFPTHTDISLGAIPYNFSTAEKETSLASGVFFHPSLKTNKSSLATNVVTIIQQQRLHDPTGSIAILVRNRQHLLTIIPLLKSANLEFTAIEIDSLNKYSSVHDLTALTQALFHLGDRLSWLTILRAPWCGLTLADLHVLASYSQKKTLWEILENYQHIPELSTDAQLRLERLVTIFSIALAERGRLKLRTWVEKTWRALNGHYCLTTAAELVSVQAYFNLLEELELERKIIDPDLLEKKIISHYISTATTNNNNLQLMTIHKAKGLEFDTVIIPHLENRGRNEEEQLLLWQNRLDNEGINHLILAPIKAKKEEHDSIYHYLRQVNRKKSLYELTRLLYVAGTRAKKSLHLFADLTVRDQELVNPDAHSFLSLLWPVFKQDAVNFLSTSTTDSNTPATAPIKIPLRRLKNQFFLTPAANVAFTETSYLKNSSANSSGTINQLLGEESSHRGIIIHRCLQQIATEGICNWNSAKLSKEKQRWQTWLLQLGNTPTTLDENIHYIEQALTNTLNDERGQWIFSQQHSEQKNEFPLTTLINGTYKHLIIDRTFVDKHSQCWIIDYKTSSLSSNNKDLFLTAAKIQYQHQLEMYATAFQHLTTYPIKLGLYFPVFGGWCEWDFFIAIPAMKNY